MNPRRSPEIVFEDGSLLVIFKPAGWVVNRAESVRDKTIQDWVEGTGKIPLQDKDDQFRKRSGVVHRLDKATSGLLIVGRNPAVFANLQSQFKQRTVEKEYRALVHGRPRPEEGVIQLPVGRKPRKREEFGVVLGGRPAETRYQVLEELSSPDQEPVSLLALFPKTGRTHQLRVHLKHLGYPIVGDPVYGGRKNIRRDERWCGRLFLHAYRVQFNHPVTGKRVQVIRSLPNRLNEVLAKLRSG